MSENKNAKTPTDGGTGFNHFRASATTVLRQPQEPVAWLSEGGDVSRSKRYMDEMGFKCNPLYTAPPKREWVGLTDDEVNELVSRFKRYSYVLLREVEAKLKEKNHG